MANDDKKNNAKLKVIPLKENGELDLKVFENLISDKTKLVFVNHVSNALGVINPIEKIIEIAHKNGAVVLIDGAQSSAHFDIDLQKLDVDFSQHQHTNYVDQQELVFYMERRNY